MATADYRLIRKPEEIGVIKSLRDRALCLQFIRRHADRLGLDPQRVVLMGASAGAGTSLWIGTTDDLADPGSADPVLRQSTRVSGVVLLETQATYDIGRWSIDVFPDLGISVLEGCATRINPANLPSASTSFFTMPTMHWSSRTARERSGSKTYSTLPYSASKIPVGRMKSTSPSASSSLDTEGNRSLC